VLARQKARKDRLDADPPRCRHCNRQIDPPRRYTRNIGYCSIAHRDAAHRERDQLKRAAALDRALSANEEPVYDPESTKKGPVYDEVRRELNDTEWMGWISRLLTDVEVGKRIGRPPQSVARARRYAANEMVEAAKARGFTIQEENLKLLGPSDAEMRKLLAEDPEQFEVMLDELVDAFVAWRSKWFRVWAEVTYITKAVHRHWIKAVLRTIYTGGRLMILSPPRHGKTELLIHFCVWLICRNPDIRILYLGPNKDIAENSVGQVKNLLATHAELQAAYLPPGQSWEPSDRHGKLWRDSKFKVGNRTLEQKQPTMWAGGPGAKITSLDADFIVVDDPADPDDSQMPAGRLKISKWFKMKVLTRKMRFSGLAMISSRVHFDDLYSEYIDNPKWTVIVDKAHDFGVCGLGLYDDHAWLEDPDACVLFPEMNPLEHLQDQCDDITPALFDMMFQNMPRPEGTLIFDPDIIRANALDRSRGLGVSALPDHILVAGLDPATRNTQASFLWAFDFVNDHEYMVDLETEEAGGIEGAIRLIRHWNTTYGCLIFVIEDVGFQVLYHDDPRMKALKVEIPGLQILPCSTGANKHDPYFGVSGMAARLHSGRTVLPYGTPDAIRKTDRFIRQAVLFTGDTGQKTKHKSDILMAAWFPMPDVVRRLKGIVRGNKAKVAHTGSYPGYETTLHSQAPWQKTQYPT